MLCIACPRTNRACTVKVAHTEHEVWQLIGRALFIELFNLFSALLNWELLTRRLGKRSSHQVLEVMKILRTEIEDARSRRIKEQLTQSNPLKKVLQTCRVGGNFLKECRRVIIRWKPVLPQNCQIS